MDIDKLKFKSLLVIALQDSDEQHLQPTLQMHFKEVYFESNCEKAFNEFFGDQRGNEEIDLVLFNITSTNSHVLEKIRHTNRRIPIFTTSDDFLKIPANLILKQKVYSSYEKPIDVQIFIKECAYALKEVAKRKFCAYSHKVAAVVRMDLESQMIYANKLFLEHANYEREELMGVSFLTLKHPAASDSLFNEMWTTVRAGDIWHGILKLKASNEESFSINSTVFPILDSNNRIKEYLNIGFIVTKEEENISKLKHYIVSQKTLQIKSNKKLDETIQRKIEQAVKNEQNKVDELKKIIYELEEDLNKNKSIRRQQSQHISSLETTLKRIREKEASIDIVLKEKLRATLMEKYEMQKQTDQLSKRNETLSEKLEKAQESVKVFQGYIDEYRKKIEDLHDVIAANEKEIKELKK
jgi:PAS domain-containing protein